MRRPLRPAVRLHARLIVDGRVWTGVSRNISTSGISLIVPRDPNVRLIAGSSVLIEVTFPNKQQLQLQGKLVWVTERDTDFRGEEMTAVGVHFDHATAELEAFVAAFKPIVAVYEPSADTLAILEEAAGEYHVRICADRHALFQTVATDDISALIVDHDHESIAHELEQRFPRAFAALILVGGDATVELAPGSPRAVWQVPAQCKASDLRASLHPAVAVHAMYSENDRLYQELERAVRHLERENAYLRKRVEVASTVHIVGESPELRQVLAEVKRVGFVDVPVHVRGETGTGKELIARALHAAGPRSQKPFVAHNCGGMNETLLQSTLFGYKRGAFTGAERDRPGVFQQATGGTLFLDEVAELPESVQASLLRAVANGEVVPVGSAQPERVDVRIVSATHKDLRAEIKAQRFREDLYFRLVVVPLHMPALRERRSDIVILAKHFLDQFNARYGKQVHGLSADAMAALDVYAWPGNVRELENEMQRLVIMCESGEEIGMQLLSPHIAAHNPPSAIAPAGALVVTHGLTSAVTSMERQIIVASLERQQWNVSQVAKELKLARQTLQDKMRKLGIEKPTDAPQHSS